MPADIFDSEAGEVIQEFDMHEDWIGGLSQYPGKEWVLSGGYDGNAYLWDTRTLEVIQIFEKPPVYQDPSGLLISESSEITQIDINQNGSMIAVSTSGGPKIWKLNAGTLVQFPEVDCIRAFAWIDDGNMIMLVQTKSFGIDGTEFKIWNISDAMFSHIDTQL